MIMIEVREVVVPGEEPAAEALETFMASAPYARGDRLSLADGRSAIIAALTTTRVGETVAQSVFVEFVDTPTTGQGA